MEMNKQQVADFRSQSWYHARGVICGMLAIGLALGLRLLEWPCWQNAEYRLGNEMLLATHDAYHWLAGAEGFGRAAGHPMAEMLRIIANILHLPAANVAFWFPAVLASLVSGIVFIWGWALGSMEAGLAAGLIASISPGFLGRTLLGYYDTDLVTLFFPLLISVAPAFWCMRYMLLPQMALARLARTGSISIKSILWFGKKKSEKCAVQDGKLPFSVELRADRPLGARWIILLAIAGIISFWTQQWHSVFPYIIRFNILLLAGMAAVMAPRNRRRSLWAGALAYSLPALTGMPGLLWPLLLLARSMAKRKNATENGQQTENEKQTTFLLWRMLLNPWLLGALWLAMAWFIIHGDILNTLLTHINAYLKSSGDSHSAGASSIIFPSVAQSIIEVQDLSLAALFPYFHPWLEAAIAGFAGYIIVVFKRPGALFLLPLAALGLLSSRLGGRMVMFGAPIVALGISMPLYWLIARLLRSRIGATASGWISCAILCALLVAPFIDMIPALSQGPVINRRHAAALAQASVITPPDAKLWLWWDWGYAAHYFARRETIADGAEHGGPSLYLPAAVFATDNPRFARQIIRYTSARGNEPGNFFEGLNAESAQELINRLRSADTPLERGKGRQYIVVSFEMLRLGFWISNYGNWNFVTCQGEGGALSIVPQALAYNLHTGEVRLEGADSIILPTSITVFDETGVVQRNYVQEWFKAHPDAPESRQKAMLESRRNINFLFNRVTDEKLAVDEGIYKSLMTHLLVCDPGDPSIAPYFKLVYDNVFARIYEVLPAPGDNSPDGP